MPNFFTDNEDLMFQLSDPELREVAALAEHDFAEKDEYPYAPESVDDAVDSYSRVLTMLGEIAGDFIAPRAVDVDEEGPTLEDGVVTYAKGTQEAMDVLAKSDLMGFTLPRKYGGLNMPVTIYSMGIELISRADASLMTIFGLQDIAETINSFADEKMKDEYLPRFCTGEVTGAMVLTEPDAGSDLQAVQLRAVPEDGDDGVWRLTGVKRFISNGCGDVLLVLARSEEGSTSGSGLSLFLCEKGEGVRIRRIEHKLGIRGSPTCEIQFTDAPGRLIGRRRRGLTRYVMALMNGARLGIASQSLGIAEAAYRAALEFSREREQFGKAIIEFPAVYEILTEMKIGLEAARALVVDTAMIVDVSEILEENLEAGEEQDKRTLADLKSRSRAYSKYAATLTPMSKYYASELAMKTAADAIQIHGGSGFMKDYEVERYFRDARITTIYEGTSQLQVVAATGPVLSGNLNPRFEEYRQHEFTKTPKELHDLVNESLDVLNRCVQYIKDRDERDYTDFHARRLVDIAIDTYISYLLLRAAERSEHKALVAEAFIRKMRPRVDLHARYIESGETTVIENHRSLLR